MKMYKQLIVIIFCFTIIILFTQKHSTHAQTNGSLNLLGHFGGATNAVFVVDDTVYIGLGGALAIVDVSNPDNAIVVGKSDQLADVIWGIEVVDTIAYVATTSVGLVTVDVSDPTNPLLLGSIDTDGLAIGVQVMESTAYIANHNSLVTVDVSDPTNLLLLGSINTIGDVYDVRVVGNVAYIADFNNGLVTVDVSNPANLVLLGSVDTTGDAIRIDVVGNIVYVSDFNDDLVTVDVSDPASPIILGSIDIIGATYDVEVVEDTAYMATGVGLVMVDVADTFDPTLIGSIDTPGSAIDVVVVSDIAYIADWSSGLVIVDVSDPVNPIIIGSVDIIGAPHDVEVVDSIAYVVGTDSLVIVDVSDPINPTVLSSIDTVYMEEYRTSITVVEGIAYIVGGTNGLMIMDVNVPSNPTILSSIDTVGSAYDITVVGNIAYIADWSNGLVIVDVSDSVNPIIIGSVDTGDARRIEVVGNIAYIADLPSDLVMVDVSDPANPNLIESVNTLGYVYDIDVVANVFYVASGGRGLYMFRHVPFDGIITPVSTQTLTPSLTPTQLSTYTPTSETSTPTPTPRLEVTIQAVAPDSYDAVSEIGVGGTGRRHFKLQDVNGSSIASATVNFSDGSTTTTDNYGFFEYNREFTLNFTPITLNPDDIIETHEISIDSIVDQSGSLLDLPLHPPFRIDVLYKPYSHRWNLGTGVTAGLGAGAVAYIEGGLKQDLTIELVEKIAESPIDDQLKFTSALNSEVSVGIELPDHLQVAAVGAGSFMASAEVSVVGRESMIKTFDDPYSQEQQEQQAYAILLHALLNNGVTSVPRIAMWTANLDNGLYSDADTSIEVGMEIDGIIDLEIDVSQLGISDIESVTVFSQPLINASMMFGRVEYNNENEDRYYSYIQTLKTANNTESKFIIDPGIERLDSFFDEIGITSGKSDVVRMEIIIDSLETGSLSKRMEAIKFTVTRSITRAASIENDIEAIITEYTISGDLITSSVLENTPYIQEMLSSIESTGIPKLTANHFMMEDDLDTLLDEIAVVAYQVHISDGKTQERFSPQLSFIDGSSLGLNLEMIHARTILVESGFITNARKFPTETYTLSTFPDEPDTGISQILDDAFGSVGQMLIDSFVDGGTALYEGGRYVFHAAGEAIEDAGRAIVGGIELIFYDNLQRSKQAQVGISSISWYPADTPDLPMPLNIPLGKGFAVGSIYEIVADDPDFVLPTASLNITYTDSVADGIPEDTLHFVQWDEDAFAWIPISAQYDPAENRFTANISKLGTFTIGHDQQDPQLELFYPENEMTYPTGNLSLAGLLLDAGAGIDPNDVIVTVDGEVVDAEFEPRTGELTYISPTPLSSGEHGITIVATDTFGNSVNLTRTITMEGEVTGAIGSFLWSDLSADNVRDFTTDDEPIVGAVVVATNTEGEAFSTETDEHGIYLIDELPYGTYTVTVNASSLGDKQFADIVSDPDGANDGTTVVTISPDNVNVSGQNFGFSAPPDPTHIGLSRSRVPTNTMYILLRSILVSMLTALFFAGLLVVTTRWYRRR